MSDTIADDMQILSDVEVAWLSDGLSKSIANLGYPVGCGVAPKPEHVKRAAETLFDRYAHMIEKAYRAGLAAGKGGNGNG